MSIGVKQLENYQEIEFSIDQALQINSWRLISKPLQCNIIEA
jgi:hypothetical protein